MLLYPPHFAAVDMVAATVEDTPATFVDRILAKEDVRDNWWGCTTEEPVVNTVDVVAGGATVVDSDGVVDVDDGKNSLFNKAIIV